MGAEGDEGLGVARPAVPVGYDLGVIPQPVFTMLVIMGVVTTVMTGPLLKLLLPRTGHLIPVGVEA